MNKKILLVLISVILIGFILLFSIYLKPEKKTGGTSETLQTQTEEIKEIVVNASRFEYDPPAIRVKKGERIKLTINNTDALHGIRIPELGINGNDFVEFTAEKAGQFIWYCNNFCGEGHRQMQGKLIVE